MKGSKPKLENVIPMKGDIQRPVPEAPEWMSSEGRNVWDRLAAQMIVKERLEPHYEDTFAAYCEAVADYVELTACIALEGRTYTVKTRNGMQQKKVAAWGARQEALTNMRQLGALFGMSPVDERRLAGSGQGDLLDLLEKQLNGTD